MMYVKAGIKNFCNQSQYFLSIPPTLQPASSIQTSITRLFPPCHPFNIQVHFILRHRTFTFTYMFCASAWSQGIACMYVHSGHRHTAHSPTVWLHTSGSCAVSLFEYLSVCVLSCLSTPYLFHLMPAMMCTALHFMLFHILDYEWLCGVPCYTQLFHSLKAIVLVQLIQGNAERAAVCRCL